MSSLEPERGRRAAAAAAGLLVAAAVLSSQLALSNALLLFAAVAAWRAWRAGALAGRPHARVLLPPLAAFAATSVVSAVASLDPLTSLGQLPRLLVVLLVPLAAALVDPLWWRRLVAGLAAATTVLAVWGIVQFAQGSNDLAHRITGPLSHYMTYSGWLLLAVLVLLSELLFAPRGRVWMLAPPAVLGFAAILLSYTRNAWVGLGVGLLVLAGIWSRKVLILYPVLAVVVWVAFPHAVLDRALSILDPRQPANYDRLCMIVSGSEMVRDHPWTGVGLDMVRRVYPLYRRDDAPRWRVPHLHNNALQIAAERGLPALAAYLWLLAAFARHTLRGLKHLDGRARAAVAASLVAITGITIAGLFEYNFWDAEVQYLTLVIMGAGVGFVDRDAVEAA